MQAGIIQLGKMGFKLALHLKRNNLLFDTEDANTYFVKKMGIGEIQNANIVEEFWRLCFREKLKNLYSSNKIKYNSF